MGVPEVFDGGHESEVVSAVLNLLPKDVKVVLGESEFSE